MYQNSVKRIREISGKIIFYINEDKGLYSWKKYIPTEEQLEISKKNLKKYLKDTKFYLKFESFSGGCEIFSCDFKSVLQGVPMSEQVKNTLCVAVGGAKNKSKGTNPKRVKKSVYW